MSQIRSKWTVQEKKVHNLLKGHKIKHKMHPKIEGSPDLVLTHKKTAVFLNGCFWHKCPKCYITPKSRKYYWLQKIEKNVLRDRTSKKILRKKGFSVVSLWGHDLKRSPEKVLERVA